MHMHMHMHMPIHLHTNAFARIRKHNAHVWVRALFLGVCAYIKARAVAEDRYARGLKEAAEASGGGSGVLAAFSLGARGDVTRDSNTLFAALEASRAGAAKVLAAHRHTPPHKLVHARACCTSLTHACSCFPHAAHSCMHVNAARRRHVRAHARPTVPLHPLTRALPRSVPAHAGARAHVRT